MCDLHVEWSRTRDVGDLRFRRSFVCAVVVVLGAHAKVPCVELVCLRR
jgi:hypothetical protein